VISPVELEHQPFTLRNPSLASLTRSPETNCICAFSVISWGKNHVCGCASGSYVLTGRHLTKNGGSRNVRHCSDATLKSFREGHPSHTPQPVDASTPDACLSLLSFHRLFLFNPETIACLLVCRGFHTDRCSGNGLYWKDILPGTNSGVESDI